MSFPHAHVYGDACKLNDIGPFFHLPSLETAMQDQGAHRKHDWELEERVGYPGYDKNYIEIEVCSKCKAKRFILYPHGIMLKSEPDPVPESCPVILGKEGNE